LQSALLDVLYRGRDEFRVDGRAFRRASSKSQWLSSCRLPARCQGAKAVCGFVSGASGRKPWVLPRTGRGGVAEKRWLHSLAAKRHGMCAASRLRVTRAGADGVLETAKARRTRENKKIKRKINFPGVQQRTAVGQADFRGPAPSCNNLRCRGSDAAGKTCSQIRAEAKTNRPELAGTRGEMVGLEDTVVERSLFGLKAELEIREGPRFVVSRYFAKA